MDQTLEDRVGQDVAPTDDLLYEAWCVIANVGHERGGWDAQDPVWLAAAERWRDRWHAALGDTAEDEADDETRAALEKDGQIQGRDSYGDDPERRPG